MGVAKFLKKFASLILVFLFSVILCLLTGELLIKYYLSENNISSSVNIALNSRDNNSISSDIKGKTLYGQIEKDAAKFNVRSDVVNEVLNSKELNSVFTSYFYDYSKYLLEKKEKPTLEKESIVSVVNYYTIQNNNALSEQDKEALDKYITKVTNKINKNMINTSDIKKAGININKVRKAYKIVSSYECFLITVLSLMIIVTLLILLSEQYKVVKNISIGMLISGVIMILSYGIEVKGMQLYLNSDGLIDGLLTNVLSNNSLKFLFIGAMLVIIGLILMIMYFNISKKHKEKSDQILNRIVEKSFKRPYKEKLKDHKVDEKKDLEDIKEEQIETKESDSKNEKIEEKEIKVEKPIEIKEDTNIVFPEEIDMNVVTPLKEDSDNKDVEQNKIELKEEPKKEEIKEKVEEENKESKESEQEDIEVL